ncbi:MAG: hypothetical protein Q9219_003306 [cf. Caloplaca sp. 3 TL-2023]
MEFPYDLLTSIRSISSQDGFPGKPKEQPEDASWGPISTLQAAWTFRRHKLLVAQGQDDSTLWLFELLGSDSNTTIHENTDIPELAAESGLQAIGSGTFTSQDLRRISTEFIGAVGHPDSDVHVASFGTARSQLFTPGMHGQAATIYDAFISALETSLAVALADEEDWIMFGADSCVRFPDSPTATGRLPFKDDASGAQQLCFDARWSLPGTLTVSGFVKSFPGFLRLSDIVAENDDLDRHGIDAGHVVFLLPFGSQCCLASLEKHRSGQSVADSSSKRLALALLSRSGLQCATDVVWVRLWAPQECSQDNLSPRAQGLRELWWPAHLCCVVLPTDYASSTEVIERIADGTFVDPIEKAGKWFFDREARQAAVEAQRKEEEDRKFRETHLPNSCSEHQADDDTTTCRTARTDQYLNAQEASSIYPTPPDGLASHAQSSSVHPDPNRISSVEGHANMGDDDITRVRLSDVNTPGTDAPGGFLGNEGNQDFDDMDTDIFEGNGLTEDDFKFFDELDGKDDDIGIEYEQPASLHLNTPQKADEDRTADGSPGGDNDLCDTHMETESEGITSSQAGHEEVLDHPLPNRPWDSFQQSTRKSDIDGSIPEHDSGEQMQNSKGDCDTMLDLQEEISDPDHLMKQSSFDLVTLRSHLHDLDNKYRNDGKYAATTPETLTGSRLNESYARQTAELPTIGTLPASSEDSSEDLEEEIRYGLDDWDKSSQAGSPREEHNTNASDEVRPPPSKKRKRQSSTGNGDLATPADSSGPPGPESPMSASSGDDSDFDQELSEFHAARDLLTLFEDHPRDSKYTFVGDDEVFVQIAQLVAEQHVLRKGLLEVTFRGPRAANDSHIVFASNSFLATMQGFFPEPFPSSQCDLKTFLELGTNQATQLSADASLKATGTQETPERRRQATAQNQTGKSQHGLNQKLSVPYLSVRRGDDVMEVTPPAFCFWEELGLAPVQQNRDVKAFCIYPEHGTIRDAVSTFFETMMVSYQGCKLGRHQLAPEMGKYQDGFVPVPTTNAEPSVYFENLEEVCASLGTEIPPVEVDGTDYVIYMVNPFNNDGMLPHLASAFLRLSSSYASDTEHEKRGGLRGLVFQVVPISFLADCHRPAIPPPDAYTRLAFEVYSRCNPPPWETETFLPPPASTSAIRLAKPIPKTVNFRLTPQPPEDLLSAESCIHLAYNWDPDQQWLACAWSDNLGALHWNAVYCLQDPQPDFWAAFSVVVKEILETTKELVETTTMPWKLYVVKDRPSQLQELEVWRLHSASLFPKHVTVTVLSMEIHPPLSFPPNRSTPFPSLSTMTDTSPAASTPFDQVHTPDHSSPITATHTPSRHIQNSPAAASSSTSGFTEADPSARLIDVVSETWSMLSPSPIPDPYILTPHLAPILVSGYLLKRAGPEDRDGLITLGVNLVAADLVAAASLQQQQQQQQGKEKEKEKEREKAVLREVLGMYGDLACLARLRGVEGWREGVLPVHVAAARKAGRGVRGCMRWGKKGGRRGS